jgi:hypothetical protein
MTLVVVFAVLGALFFGGYSAYDEERIDMSLAVMGIVMGGIFMAVLGAIIALGLWAVLPEETTMTTFNLRAMSDQVGISGRFGFLGAGQIESEPYFFWYEEKGTGFALGKCLAEKVVVFESADSLPMGKHYRITTRSSWYRHLTLPISNEMWEFQIPPGSIISGFRLDLQ